jgi:branched-chain amino acid transport system ATP-binding protein
MKTLKVENLSVVYGHHQAVKAVSLTARTGEIVVILGANGAGKTSLLNAIGGLVPCRPGGSILFGDVAMHALPPHLFVEHGVAMVPEGRWLFGALTVIENLRLGAFPHRARAGADHRLGEILKRFPRLAERRGQRAATMSGGEQQMLAIGRALMSAPEIVLLDEPSLGLSPIVCKELFKDIKRIAAAGVGILMVEQNAALSLSMADRGYVLENGRIVREGSAAELRADPAVVDAYLGG